jgi:hypothetical protein
VAQAASAWGELKVKEKLLNAAYVLLFLAGVACVAIRCSGVVAPDLYYWAICEAPGMGYLHEGPFDTRQEAVDAGFDLEEEFARFGIYLECEVRTQEQRPLVLKQL